MKGEQRAESYYPPRSLHSFHLLFVDLHSLEMPGHALTLAISYSSFIVTSSYQTLRIQDQQRCYSPMGEPSEVHLMFPSLKTDCLASGTMPDYLKSVQCSQWNFFFVLASPLFLFERLMPIWSEFFNQGNLVSGSCWPSPPHSPLHTLGAAFLVMPTPSPTLEPLPQGSSLSRFQERTVGLSSPTHSQGEAIAHLNGFQVRSQMWL